MPLTWYTVHSHPNKEDLLWEQILARGFESFYPRIRVHPTNPRARKIKAYFPGYLFVRADLEASGLSVFQWMPFATGLVSFGGEPAPVPDPIIAGIRQRIAEIADAGGVLFDGLKSGDPVVIHSGPFSGYEAIFDVRLSGSERVRVLLKMLNERRVPLDLEAGQIEKKSSTQPGSSPTPHPNG
jgi:transcription antitermination factor NusG